MADQSGEQQIAMNPANMYREETFTDRRVGTLQKLIPITTDGSDDASRPVLFMGQTQVMTPAGALPLSFEIEATTLADAVRLFGDRAQDALEQTMRRLEEMRRESASSLIVPGGGGGMPGGGMPGAGGRGGIQIP